MQSVNDSVSTPSPACDLVINPIYARSFAMDINDKLCDLGVQKVKHSHLLAVHEALVKKKLAFPGVNPKKLDQAVALVYDSLLACGTRVGKKNAFTAADAVLYERSALLRKPLYVLQSQIHDESILQGHGIDDNHWCVTQWVPWMLKDGQELIDEINSLLFGNNGEDAPYKTMSIEEFRFTREQLHAMSGDFYILVDIIDELDVGHEILKTHGEFLKRVDCYVSMYHTCVLFKYGRVVRSGVELLRPSLCTMKIPSQKEMDAVIKNTRIKLKLDLQDEYEVEQSPFAMTKASFEQIDEVIRNAKIKLTLVPEDPDQDFDAIKKS